MKEKIIKKYFRYNDLYYNVIFTNSHISQYSPYNIFYPIYKCHINPYRTISFIWHKH